MGEREREREKQIFLLSGKVLNLHKFTSEIPNVIDSMENER